MGYIELLPEELISLIYKRYYTDYVLNEIKNKKCFYKYGIGSGRPLIKCNLNTIDSAFCLFCWYQFNYL